MILLNKLKNKELLSSNEILVANFLINYEGNILQLKASDISKETFTSASTTIRLAQKLGYDGWISLREAIYTEKNYLNNSHKDINPNFPFSYKDSIQKISNLIEQLESQTIHETAQLIQHDELSKCITYLSQANTIYIFAMANTATITFDFQYKMRFLFKKVEIINNRDDFSFIFQLLKESDCCIFISYSGNTFEVLDYSSIIKNCCCQTISITSYQENILVNCTDAHLYIPKKEENYAKIGHFSSNTSIHYLLDTLYACTFSKNYEKNIQKRKIYIKHTDKRDEL